METGLNNLLDLVTIFIELIRMIETVLKSQHYKTNYSHYTTIGDHI